MNGKTHTAHSELDSDVDMDHCDGFPKVGAFPFSMQEETDTIPRKPFSKQWNIKTDITQFPESKHITSVNPKEVNLLGLGQKMSTHHDRESKVYNPFGEHHITNDFTVTEPVFDSIDKRQLSGSSGYFSASSDLLSGNSGCDLSNDFDSLNIKESVPEDSGPTDTRNFTECSDSTKGTEFDEFDAETIESIYQQDQDGDTHLHTAIITLQACIAITFINMAPDQKWLDIPNALLQTPLHLAILTQQMVVVRRLMVGGASLTCQDIKGNTPLHLACMVADKESVGVLMQPLSCKETAQNRYDVAYQSIPQDFEIKNYNGQTCLHVSAEHGYIDVVNILLCKGANINSQDGKSGRCILHYAVEAGNKDLLSFLLQQRGINISATTYGDQTAIQLAYGRNIHEFVKILHECGANINEEDM